MRSSAADDLRIRRLRPPKPHVDPYVAHGSLLEEERRPGGTIERALTVFHAGAECPFTCSFCDLWQWTVDGPTPPGALTGQLAAVLGALEGPAPDRLKLYNASNFFDRRAVPAEDLDGLGALGAAFAGVTVESHANTIGPPVLAFAERLAGRLEVAMGLETVDPAASAHLNKRLDLARFDQSARYLADHGIDLRVFVLLGVPYTQPEEAVEWAVRTVRHAAARGAAVVSVIPVRGGNGEMERLASLGRFCPPTLAELEAVIDGCRGIGSTVVTADLWDVERLPACGECQSRRVDRLRRLNLFGAEQPRVVCDSCTTP